MSIFSGAVLCACGKSRMNSGSTYCRIMLGAARSDMSEGLQRSTGSIGTVSNVSKHAAEIEGFLAGETPPELIATH